MKANNLRKEFLKFFEERGHEVVPSSSLLPADPTSLFTSAGMQQFVPYLSGMVESPYKRACSVQKCLRVGDIDEVGDDTHHTFFEMLGNWSFGDYFKEEAIDFALDFLINVCHLEKEKMRVSVFGGEGKIPKDEEAINLWLKKGFSQEKIYEFGMKDNFWGPVAKTGPCGPCSEIYYDRTNSPCAKGKNCGVDCECKRFVEIWNLVFMEYNKRGEGNFEKMAKRNIDTGIGFERLFSLLQEKSSAYETELFWPMIEMMEGLSETEYSFNKRSFRIIADHLRASAFMISEGVLPSNIDRGYVLRRLLRRTIREARNLKLENNWHELLAKRIVEIYSESYPELEKNQESIINVIYEEREKFERTLERGLKEFEKIAEKKGKEKNISGVEAFDLYQSYGFPIELIKEMTKEKGFTLEEKNFEEAFNKHKEISRAGAEKKFGGVGIDQIENKEEKQKVTRLHTATHLLHQALRTVLGEHVRQMGSDITPERLRFDFVHPQKIEQEELKKVEDLVNEKIKEGLAVKKEMMSLEEAKNSGALSFLKERYPTKVSVYTIADRKEGVFSKEICAGPHVENTAELGKFKITKQESAGAGIRRIRAVLE